MRLNLQELSSEEILNGKLHFCVVAVFRLTSPSPSGTVLIFR